MLACDPLECCNMLTGFILNSIVIVNVKMLCCWWSGNSLGAYFAPHMYRVCHGAIQTPIDKTLPMDPVYSNEPVQSTPGYRVCIWLSITYRNSNPTAASQTSRFNRKNGSCFADTRIRCNCAIDTGRVHRRVYSNYFQKLR